MCANTVSHKRQRPRAEALLTMVAALPSLASPAPLHDALLALPFSNVDVTRASHNFSMRSVSSVYLESETPLKARWAWADGRVTPFHTHSYLFVANATANATTGGAGQGVPGWGVPPAGMRSAPPLGGLATGTVELRSDGTLQAWTIENSSPAGSTKLSRLDLAVLGVRFPSRFGATARTHSLMVRTRPPVAPGVTPADGVSAIEFSGAQPYTRLTPSDPSLPEGLRLQIFGRSRWRLGDMTRSHTPAVGFTLTASNPSAAPINVTLFLSLPMGLQHGVNRCDGGQGPDCFLHTRPPSFSTPDASACLAACTAKTECLSWSFDGAATPTEHGNCTLSAAVPPAYNAWGYYQMVNGTDVPGEEVPGAASGVKGVWSETGGCLTLDRPGAHAQAGNLSLCASSEGGTVSMRPSFCASDELSPLWSEFKASGALCQGRPPITRDSSPIGAAAVTVMIPPGGNASATISMGWYFPHRDWAKSGSPPETVGNHYSSLFASSEEPARALLDDEEAVADVRNWSAYVAALTRSSLPDWYGDSLLNSLHHTRSAMWLSQHDDTGVPKWRQWESFSCVNVDSVHNDGERHLAYLLTFGINGTKSKMRAWAKGQCPPTSTNPACEPGMIQEQLATGCMAAVPALDTPSGRTMGDVSSMFIVYLLELWQWGGDEEAVRELWPAARRAAQWQMARAGTWQVGGQGLPVHVIDTYDGLRLDSYSASAFSGFFHLLAMKAAAVLARSPIVNDFEFADNVTEALVIGQRAMDRLLWNESGGFYRSYTAPQDVCGPHADGSRCWHSYYKDKSGVTYTERGGLCCEGTNGCGPQHEAAPQANATFAQAQAACDALPNCSAFCFASPESDLKPTSPVLMMWKTSTSGFSPNPTPVGANAIMADCTYANVLADSLGISPLTTDKQIVSHLRKVVASNDSPYGFIVQTGRYHGATHTRSGDNSLWMMANPNWATLFLRRGGDVDQAMGVMAKTLRWWRDDIKDMWNVVAVGGGVGNPAQPAGSPQANSHYGYHMTMWHTVGALSGQLYDAPAGNLSFMPRLRAPFTLPVLLPGSVLTLAQKRARGPFTLRFEGGVPLLQLKRLSADGRVMSKPRPLSTPGEAMTWG